MGPRTDGPLYVGQADEGAQLGELARRAATLFEAQPAAAKRKLLDYVVGECWWRGGEMEPVFKEPFGMLAASRLNPVRC